MPVSMTSILSFLRIVLVGVKAVCCMDNYCPRISLLNRKIQLNENVPR